MSRVLHQTRFEGPIQYDKYATFYTLFVHHLPSLIDNLCSVRPVTDARLLQPMPINKGGVHPPSASFKPLQSDEALTDTTVVAVGVEFVALRLVGCHFCMASKTSTNEWLLCCRIRMNVALVKLEDSLQHVLQSFEGKGKFLW